MAGSVSEVSCYHHGEASLQGAIIGMAQNFVGSNNINLLMPNGQFGTRIMGGSDAASPRYIHTQLNPITDYIYPKEDFPLLSYIDDDGTIVEPRWYCPIIPMVLVNGMIGIGTGFSTKIPQYNPLHCCKNIKKKLNGGGYSWMAPYYRGFKGKIEKVDQNHFISRGIYELDGEYVVIKELPVGVWTDDYKSFLEKMIQENEPWVLDYEKSFNR